MQMCLEYNTVQLKTNYNSCSFVIIRITYKKKKKTTIIGRKSQTFFYKNYILYIVHV